MMSIFFFFNDTATTEIYTLSLHDALPISKKGIEETLRLAERLAGRGYEVAPHISARLVRDEAHLEDVLGRLREAGLKDVFVIAGDADEPAGKFEDAAALLRTMAEIGHDFEEVGIKIGRASCRERVEISVVAV